MATEHLTDCFILLPNLKVTSHKMITDNTLSFYKIGHSKSGCFSITQKFNPKVTFPHLHIPSHSHSMLSHYFLFQHQGQAGLGGKRQIATRATRIQGPAPSIGPVHPSGSCGLSTKLLGSKSPPGIRDSLSVAHIYLMVASLCEYLAEASLYHICLAS